MSYRTSHLTRAYINLDNLAHNMRLLQEHVGKRPLWPAIKANAYGHDARIIGERLVSLGYDTLCVAHVSEAIELVEAGVQAKFIILSATLAESCEYLVAYGFEPAVCEIGLVEELARVAEKTGKKVSVHVKVDTGMGRIGIAPEDTATFLERCGELPAIRVRGLMSHFPRADETDKSYSREQARRFRTLVDATRQYGIEVYHLANSAGIFDLPESCFDAARPGISIYGLKPSLEMVSARVDELRPVLEWKTRITYLKEVPAGTGLSYGHTFHTDKPSLIATVPVGYGDGLSRLLSNNAELLVRNRRCPLVGRVTMDQSLVDVTALRQVVRLGDEVTIIGRQGGEVVSADELAQRVGTINYEIVTAIARRVPRISVEA
ncbi:MAG: alanine racemase [Gammaproteobacteria bacterium]|nr:alanine racemase [Gammaproteobacteria bacterium]NIN39576.1 alanine racemase [Gammaproteobacteria bacterium]NIO25133.1 alanine racemase [Gammaproteobacteria bacterium]NIO65762.1 alanine racemase [Gammaproteobacteria bacterium]NIP45801.1 alanine racemase [Gammaproteobacteria bacterium]